MVIDKNKQLETEESIPLSKTKVKQQMNELQALGMELIKLSNNQLSKFDLSEDLLIAIKFTNKINSNGAIRRHYQHIGKLMRETDEQAIRATLATIKGDSTEATKLLHFSEKWRDELLADDSALDKFITKYNDFNINELRTLIRLVRKEQAVDKKKHFTQSFRFIREIIERKS